MENNTDDKYPEILGDLRDDMRELLGEYGLDPAMAAEIAAAASERIRFRWQGLNIYIPKGQQWELQRRDYEINRRYNGGNKLELCREYGISEQRFYQIMAKVRAEKVARNQHRIPGF